MRVTASPPTLALPTSATRKPARTSWSRARWARPWTPTALRTWISVETVTAVSGRWVVAVGSGRPRNLATTSCAPACFRRPPRCRPRRCGWAPRRAAEAGRGAGGGHDLGDLHPVVLGEIADHRTDE